MSHSPLPVGRVVSFTETVTVRYRIECFDDERRRTPAKVEVSNQDGVLAPIADRLQQWVDNA